MQGDSVGEMGSRKAVIAIVQVHTVVILCVFNHLKGEADPLSLAGDHIIRALKIVEELLLGAHDFKLVVGCEGNGYDFEDVFG